METVITAEVNTYVEFIDRLPGVVSSNVVIDGESISEIHVLGDTSRSSNQYKIDIQSLLMAQFDYHIESSKIHVVLLEKCNYLTGRSRLIIDEVCVSKRRDSTQIVVALAGPDKIYEGCCACSSDKNDIIRSVAEATLSAVAEAQDHKYKFTVIDVKTATVCEETAVLICVSLRAPDGVVCHFCGSAFVGCDKETAIVKATLDAINRKICVC